MADLIDRQQAINAVKNYWKSEVDRIPKKSTDFDVFTQICDSILTHNANICKALDQLPPAQPERKKGKCIWCDSPFRIEYYWIDREGNTASFQDEDCHLVATGIAKFCPNCGRRMGGEQNG